MEAATEREPWLASTALPEPWSAPDRDGWEVVSAAMPRVAMTRARAEAARRNLVLAEEAAADAAPEATPADKRRRRKWTPGAVLWAAYVEVCQ